MLRKIYKELVAIRKELQSIRIAMEPEKKKKSIMIGIDLCDKDSADFTPILADEWEKALERMESANH